MRKGNVLSFEAKLHTDSTAARAADSERHADDFQGVVLDRLKGALLCLPQTWRRLLVLPPSRHPYKAAVFLPNPFNDPESIVVLDLKSHRFNLSSSWRRRPPSLRLV